MNYLKNAFENNLLTNIKLFKTRISKIIHSGGILGALLSKIAGPLMNAAAPIANNNLDWE